MLGYKSAAQKDFKNLINTWRNWFDIIEHVSYSQGHISRSLSNCLYLYAKNNHWIKIWDLLNIFAVFNGSQERSHLNQAHPFTWNTNPNHVSNEILKDAVSILFCHILNNFGLVFCWTQLPLPAFFIKLLCFHIIINVVRHFGVKFWMNLYRQKLICESLIGNTQWNIPKDNCVSA